MPCVSHFLMWRPSFYEVERRQTRHHQSSHCDTTVSQPLRGLLRFLESDPLESLGEQTSTHQCNPSNGIEHRNHVPPLPLLELCHVVHRYPHAGWEPKEDSAQGSGEELTEMNEIQN